MESNVVLYVFCVESGIKIYSSLFVDLLNFCAFVDFCLWPLKNEVKCFNLAMKRWIQAAKGGTRYFIAVRCIVSWTNDVESYVSFKFGRFFDLFAPSRLVDLASEKCLDRSFIIKVEGVSHCGWRKWHQGIACWWFDYLAVWCITWDPSTFRRFYSGEGFLGSNRIPSSILCT